MIRKPRPGEGNVDRINATDEELRYLGLSERQLDILRDQPPDMRVLVYEEQLRLLMERDTNNDTLRGDLGGLGNE